MSFKSSYTGFLNIPWLQVFRFRVINLWMGLLDGISWIVMGKLIPLYWKIQHTKMVFSTFMLLVQNVSCFFTLWSCCAYLFLYPAYHAIYLNQIFKVRRVQVEILLAYLCRVIIILWPCQITCFSSIITAEGRWVDCVSGLVRFQDNFARPV